MATIIALAMAEIASAYPTAGGLYYWASKLGSPGWGWATGWFNLIGQVAVTAAIGYGLALFGQALLDFWFSYTDAHERLVRRVVRRLDLHPVRALPVRGGADQPAEHPPDVRAEHDLGLVAHGRRRRDRRDPDHRPGQPPVALVRVHARRSTTRASETERPQFGLAFLLVLGLGMLLPQYTITGFDASAHTAEETNNASRMAATGMWTSVVVSVIFGWILLVAVTFAIPSTQGALDTVNALGLLVPWIWAESMSQNWAEALLFICVVAQFFCVTASVTSASRMMFAFSRDGAVPGHQLWRRVAKNRVPHWSVFGIWLFAGILMIPAVWNYFVGYAVGTAIAVIGLYIAFVIPVYLRWRKGDSWDEPRAWSLGKHYKWIDPLSVAWVALITIIFIIPLYKVGLPWEEGFDWRFTNYTILWFAGIGLIFGGWWFLSAQELVQGPGPHGHRGGARALRGRVRRRERSGPRSRELGRQRAPHGFDVKRRSELVRQGEPLRRMRSGDRHAAHPGRLRGGDAGLRVLEDGDLLGSGVPVEELEREQVAGRVGLAALDVLDRDHDARRRPRGRQPRALARPRPGGRPTRPRPGRGRPRAGRPPGPRARSSSRPRPSAR